ncbi:hypothetical protein HPP92_021365 [Vanilla planifolia]|uniref:MYND-type domain-containing protein n=1 Tax=Vanilla planifolia TaxID=51239 RepID=A0A835PY03_VANPL|nr:hypothetical protein HPP92_021365 [Vanilla planifolia]
MDGLPDDLVLLILSKLSSTANAPSDLINVLLTCRRLNGLASHPIVLSRLSAKGTAVKARSWTESAERFLQRCADAGSLEACYTLGMIQFYCLENRAHGASLMAKAAMGTHLGALFSIAVIQFNGSGGSKNHMNIRAGALLCTRAASYGHIDALRELGHCLQDGYGLRQNVALGRRLLIEANARELAADLFLSSNRKLGLSACSLLSDYGYNVPTPVAHPANRFMVEWFAARRGANRGHVLQGEGRKGLRMCSNSCCGRPETRRHEFRRCSVCGAVNYCSRACQAMDWKLAHKLECFPMDRWEGEGDAAAGDQVPWLPLPDYEMGEAVN